MDKILLINFRRYGDIFSMAHIIHSLKEKYPLSHISILVYKEFISAAQTLKYIDKIYTIDRKNLVTLKKNKIFPISIAFNSFHQKISEIKTTKWDQIINFSNDKLSCFLTPLLKTKEFIGIQYNKDKVIESSDMWSKYLNDVHTTYSYPSFHLVDLFHQMAQTEWSGKEIKINVNEMNNQKAFQKIEYLRQSTSYAGHKKRIIGIQFKSSIIQKDIPFDVLTSLTGCLLNDPHFYPIFLISPSSNEKQTINDLNSHFHHEIISIETDFSALPSVLLNLDLLITPDTSVKHVGDLTNTPILELASDFVPFYKQGSINVGNIVLSIPHQKEKGLASSNLKALDILETIYFMFDLKPISKLKISSEITLFQVQKKPQDIWYKPIYGPIDYNIQLGIHISKYYIRFLFENKKEESYLGYITENFDHKHIIKFLDKEKNIITNTVKNLLNTIKALRNVKKEMSSSNTSQFIIKLNEILKPLEESSIIEIPLLLFKSDLEAIISENINQNIKQMEALLFKLKGNIHQLTNCLTDLTLTKKKSSRAKIEKRLFTATPK